MDYQGNNNTHFYLVPNIPDEEPSLIQGFDKTRYLIFVAIFFIQSYSKELFLTHEYRDPCLT